jgi:hypothetical protein
LSSLGEPGRRKRVMIWVSSVEGEVRGGAMGLVLEGVVECTAGGKEVRRPQGVDLEVQRAVVEMSCEMRWRVSFAEGGG